MSRHTILILGHDPKTQFIDVYNQYTRLFDPANYHVTIAYLCGEDNPEVRARTLADEVIFFNFPKQKIRYLKIGAIRVLLKLCRERQFSMIICHRYKPIYMALWVAQFYPLQQLVFVMHELNTLKARGRQFLINRLWQPNMLFAGVSNAVRDDMRDCLKKVSPDRVCTLYNAIDVALTEPQLLTREEARKTLGLPMDAFLFGNLARLVPNKNHVCLIEAFAKIKINCPQAKLIILGNGNLEMSLKQQVAQAGLEKEIIFTGFVEKGFCYMKAFDCFVLSSQQEAFGRVLLEAMIAKLPIIATEVHGIPEVIGKKGGQLVPTKNAATLAEAMQAIYHLSAAERHNLGQQAYQHMYTHFSIPAFQQQFWAHIS